jgi:hypothetical protein
MWWPMAEAEASSNGLCAMRWGRGRGRAPAPGAAPGGGGGAGCTKNKGRRRRAGVRGCGQAAGGAACDRDLISWPGSEWGVGHMEALGNAERHWGRWLSLSPPMAAAGMDGRLLFLGL